ncbi:YdcF family protein [Leisingera sp. HS039]|uniref:YdcF family protein n=2 Tax=unclassified Leisingera TaxID=2614906 RepID=UPI0010708398|nr:YdcF family protein [Leisingera sp. HS039]MBQ4823009.1 YdcF family protein [Leisingera sp. HS039]QBR36252.1 YdcF family protein [Leisingera sp. NJS201]
MIRRITELAQWFAAAGLFTLLAVLFWTFLWPDNDPAELPAANAIICLGGGMSADGSLHAPTQKRVATCARLYHAGRAPLVVFTGGRAVPDGPSAGAQMAQLAQQFDMPPDAILIEPESQSTLQNALFSLPLLPVSENLILVSEAFHLPRSWASFRWAGARGLQLAASENVRRDPETGWPSFSILLRETAAVWFNLFRAAAWSAASTVDLQNDDWLH